MNLRVLNALVLSTILSLGVFFGINISNFKSTAAEIDADHPLKLSEDYRKTVEEITKDIVTTSNNDYNNNNTGRKNVGSSSTTQKEVNFSNFYEMYAYAVNKLNSASLVETKATKGTLEVMEGTVVSTNGIPLITLASPIKLDVDFLKQKNGREKLFDMTLSGNVIGKEVDMNMNHYTAGINYEFNVPMGGTVVLPGSTYIEKFKWDMTQPFHLPTKAVSDSLSESEIISWYKDNKGLYYSTIMIDTKNFNSNFVSILGGILGMNIPIQYTQIKIQIIVDSYGNFVSISYTDSLVIKKASIMGFDISNARANLTFTETFITIDNAPVVIKH